MDRSKRYVRINTETGDVYQDDFFTEDEAANINQKLAADGDPVRWLPYGQREGDSVAA